MDLDGFGIIYIYTSIHSIIYIYIYILIYIIYIYIPGYETYNIIIYIIHSIYSSRFMDLSGWKQNTWIFHPPKR